MNIDKLVCRCHPGNRQSMLNTYRPSALRLPPGRRGYLHPLRSRLHLELGEQRAVVRGNAGQIVIADIDVYDLNP